jgi:hypothetical protein
METARDSRLPGLGCQRELEYHGVTAAEEASLGTLDSKGVLRLLSSRVA